ncbi:diguanylate cyclase [Deinococcus sp. AJ005]|uniref:GGDEF domain-containing protein n=1 Tax=Deinococcus sp. AJ005 TaxID=2652443 RepID=UPI00125CCB00|nr:GGDEF domain-containing protein [Deinococcus sp. AJ005]QFP75752.1 GGDEF domain-containing protein [Deinococcus sp. AJ005]
MPENALRERMLEATRRRGYLVLCACSVAVHSAIATRELPHGNWRAAMLALLSAALLPAILSRRVSAQRLDTLVVWCANIGASYFLWDFSSRGLGLGARESLTVPLFFAVWFGLLPLKQAALRGGVMYLVLAALVLRHWPTDPVPLLYIGFLLFLIGQMTVAGRQIQQELSRTARYADLALTDPLTGLFNRRSMERRLEDHYSPQAIASQPVAVTPPAAVEGPAPIGILLIDVDLFKAVNDTHGHVTGDRVLVAVGQTLRSCARSGDLAFRWGGEEFVLLVAAGERAALEQICGRIHRALAEQDWPQALPRVTVSIGAALSGEAQDAAELLKLVDRRLYRAKDAGRARMVMDEAQATDLSDESRAFSAAPPELASSG